ncbi:cadherin-2-like [Denticeps clupeoides]|uniref:cadherin-2-like n=1 Tax=Denticeps clupeoides TaxID=299321 RepID=UPI0010A5946C|nr:cadherin-2-like [Denticeps clupeoides]
MDVRGRALLAALLAALQVSVQAGEASPCRRGFRESVYSTAVTGTITEDQPLLKVEFVGCGGGVVHLDGVGTEDIRVDVDGTVYAARTFRLGDRKGWSLEVRARDTETQEEWRTNINLTRQEITFPRRGMAVDGGGTLRRMKRDWVIPPINVPENSRGQFPEDLVTIRSDREWNGRLRYSVTGPGADQPPTGIFIINPINGQLSVTKPLDRELISNFHVSVTRACERVRSYASLHQTATLRPAAELSPSSI